MLNSDITGLPPFKVASIGIIRTFQLVRLFAEMSVLDNVIVGTHLVTTQWSFVGDIRFAWCARTNARGREAGRTNYWLW